LAELRLSSQQSSPILSAETTRRQRPDFAAGQGAAADGSTDEEFGGAAFAAASAGRTRSTVLRSLFQHFGISRRAYNEHSTTTTNVWVLQFVLSVRCVARSVESTIAALLAWLR
jgi:hypothetical protein